MKYLAALIAGFAISAATLDAQTSSSGVPESHRPPPGMCRIWIDGVPPTHQPAPTDCATAIRKRPMNARVVFGSDANSGTDRGIAPSSAPRSSFVAPAVPSRDEQDRAAQQQEQDRQRAAQAQREEQDRQRAEAQREAQRQHDEQEKRNSARRDPPPRERDQDRSPPPPRSRADKSRRPPR